MTKWCWLDLLDRESSFLLWQPKYSNYFLNLGKRSSRSETTKQNKIVMLLSFFFFVFKSDVLIWDKQQKEPNWSLYGTVLSFIVQFTIFAYSTIGLHIWANVKILKLLYRKVKWKKIKKNLRKMGFGKDGFLLVN